MKSSYLILLIYLIVVIIKCGHQLNTFTNPLVVQEIDIFNNIHIRNDAIYRLPNNSKPIDYDLSLVTWIHINDFAFEGLVKINIEIIEDTQEIVIHQRQLTIIRISLYYQESEFLNVNFYENIQNEFLTITSPIVLVKGSICTINISYTGLLRTDNKGFYRSSYINDDGARVYLATTQYSQTEARHGFPCYDEPGIKAKFTIRITHHSSYTAISNMPGSITIRNETVVTTEFEKTPIMSTFLVGYIISDFKFIEEHTPKLFPFRSYSRSNALNFSTFNINEGMKMLDALEEYMQIPFVLPKMYQVAIPDFFYNAMENWGLITYREGRFFFDEQKSIYSLKTAIINVIGHEFTHQWFGNLVSPQWWSHVWLKEGFATLYSYYITNLIYPEWNYMEHLVVHVKQWVFITDALESIRPMSYYVDSPVEVSSLFDSVAYNKSACVLRMFQEAFTDFSFRKGLVYYLNEKIYQGAMEEDLFDAIEKSVKEDKTLNSEFNVHQIMSSWTQQSGYPVLEVNLDGSFIHLFQRRYFSNASLSDSDSDGLWWIPFNYASSQNPDFTQTKAMDWLNVGNKTITIAGNDQPEWIIFNIKSTGYYRVQYDLNNWNALAKALQKENHDSIDVLNRAQLINDACAFAQTDRLEWQIVLELLKYLAKETEFAPWQSAVTCIKYLNQYLIGSDNYENFRYFIQTLVDLLLAEVNVEKRDERFSKTYARTLAFDIECLMNLTDFNNYALNKFNNLVLNGIEIHQNYKYLIYCNVIKNNSTNMLLLWNQMITTKDNVDRVDIAMALGCTLDSSLSKLLLKRSLDIDGPFTSEEQIILVTFSYRSNIIGLMNTIDFLFNNLDEFYLLHTTLTLQNLIFGIANRIVNEDLRDQFNKVLTLIKNKNYLEEEQINVVHQQINENFIWLNKNKEPIDRWLDNYANYATRNVISLVIIIISFIINVIM